MASTSTVQSINFLPSYLQTDKNTKFLSSTLDQLIQPAQLERIDGFIGSKITPTYSSSDNYISEGSNLRDAYALNPALVVSDINSTVQDVVALDDLINEIAVKGGINNNLDRLLRSDFYSYDPHIDWDKLINYQEYYWLVSGPAPILITNDSITVETDVIGQPTFTTMIGTATVTLSNGMIVGFSGANVSDTYVDKYYFVEGVGNSIVLLDYRDFLNAGSISSIFNETFDGDNFDSYPFDSGTSLPITPDYITINRASRDLNPWTRYNRWVHVDVITATAAALGQQPVYPSSQRATRPIIEFKPNLKLYNFGKTAVNNVDYIDNVTTDAFKTVEGTAGFYVDVNPNSPVQLEHGNRVIFNADTDPLVRGKIWEVRFDLLGNKLKLGLFPTDDHTPSEFASVSIVKGYKYANSSWWFNGTEWVYAQQHTKVNQPPLFDLFDDQGHSYADRTYYNSNFKGNQIFGYSVGTGTVDPVLGFSVNYKKIDSIGSYLFENYFTNDSILVSEGPTTISVSTAITYCQFDDMFVNVWDQQSGYKIPVLQFQTTIESTSTLAVTAIDNPTNVDFDLKVYVNNIYTTAYTTTSTNTGYYVNFDNTLAAGTPILFKIYSTAPNNVNGYYEAPLGLTNNPLNSNMPSLTLTDLEDHSLSMINNATAFMGSFPGDSNLRDLNGIEKYGRQLISNANPIAFAQLFIGKKEHSVVDAITKVADQYNQFKLGFLRQLVLLNNQTDPVGAVDQILATMNLDKNSLSPYYLSDMAPYGTDVVSRSWTVTSSRNVSYPITLNYNPTVLSLTGVLVYLNGTQLTINTDYEFDTVDSRIVILTPLQVGDVLLVKQYSDTSGSYIPPTPTKLGLYPKLIPSIYTDDTYVTPTQVIQGHDGSVMVAYGDFRDAIILELETRIYNNIKTQYRSELFNIDSVLPGAFKTTEYSLNEINDILRIDFAKWSGIYGIDYATNSTYNQDETFTYNYTGAYIPALDIAVNGSWRSIYKYLYGTDRPHTAPWEMLGFSEQPSWWESTYGPAPYTSGNLVLWEDIAAGNINGSINLIYSRPGLLNIIPVDDGGNLIDPTTILTNYTPANQIADWQFGDQGPGETVWRRSSYWPFAVQRLLALTKPVTYSSYMYDVSRMNLNIAGQWTYGSNKTFLNVQDIVIQGNNNALTAGYSVYVSEIGRQRTQNYIDELLSDITYLNYNLFHKVGGFVSQDTLQITIDAVDPTSPGPGALLTKQDYSLILNTSNPVQSISISGLIIQKLNGNFVVKGYDNAKPYFNTYKIIRNSTTPTLTVGGVSASYVVWSGSTTGGQTGLSATQTTTAESAPTSIFYQKGQIVQYGSSFYRVQVAHQAESTFNPAYYQVLSALPITGGATVQIAASYDKSAVVSIPYGTAFTTVQEVYDLIVSYGTWLVDQGFVFDEFNSNFGQTINWDFTSKEFLYWTTQNWSNNSVITLSPFADQLQLNTVNSVVDNIFDPFYEYSFLQANGVVIPKNKLSVTRQPSVCTISTLDANTGIYFATLRTVQKEHAIIFNNSTVFNDTIYNVETGFSQQRMLLNGFRTSNWHGDYFSPGFIYDTAVITNWQQYTNYKAGDTVLFAGKYYSAIKNIDGTKSFDATKWYQLNSKPTPGLIPNFDYKISQFNDFYNLNIDNFDANQQKLAQHLTGYTPRPYLTNIIEDPVAQYKFYQGFIREKGTQNAISKLSKATIHNYQGNITYNEEWALRIGQYGSYTSYNELEVSLVEGTFIDNPQVIVFAKDRPLQTANDLKYYSTASNWQITPVNYVSSMTFVTNSGTYLSNDFVLPVAGYARIDDVTYTVLNKTSLLNFADTTNDKILNGDTFWVGFTDTKDWTVLRYLRSEAQVISQNVDVPGESMDFTTDVSHGLSIGEIVSVADYSPNLDGIYQVIGIPNPVTFTVASSSTYVSSASTSTGVLFKFESARYGTFDELPDNSDILSLPVGSNVWIDDNGLGQWAVYEKVNNYSVSTASNLTTDSAEQFGSSISKRKGSGVVLIGSPNYVAETTYGRVSVYTEGNDTIIKTVSYFLNGLTPDTQYAVSGVANGFGSTVVYDDITFSSSTYGLLFAGAPLATPANTSNIQSGMVKISSIDPKLSSVVDQAVIFNPNPTNYSNFGSSIYVQRNTSTKVVLIGAPGTVTTGSGVVSVYTVTATNTVSVTHIADITNSNQFGNSISGSDDATVVAISMLGGYNAIGKVYIYDATTLASSTTPTQIITSPFRSDAGFGYKVLVSTDGEYLFVSAPYNINANATLGTVLVYSRVNGQFELNQTLTNPVLTNQIYFGTDMDINYENNSLVISAMGSGIHVPTTFDKLSTLGVPTTFDGRSTDFYSKINQSGTVYLYNRLATRFVMAQELAVPSTVDGTDYGAAITIDSNVVLVGAPAYDNSGISGNVYQFNKINSSVNGWELLRSQDNLVAIGTVQKVRLINSYNDEVMSYLDVIDPLKGRISGIADQEITYKMSIDPAVYSVGTSTTVINTNINWQDDHIGEVWWDLSTVKYQWYEQGDNSFRKNQWGQLFPGCTIDVYEWVGTNLLPSEWSALAGTAVGLTNNISGQPLNPDDSVYSLKQIYDNVTGTFSNFYYYWVKNKVTIPNVKNRRISTIDIASLISNPTNYGLQFAAILSSDAVAVANIAGQLVDSRINLNISIDTQDGNIPRHTEWQLIQEGSQTTAPNPRLEQKLFDSLLGHDSLGNPVPDPLLSSREAYGIGIRPRQSMFVDRLGALRNLIGYVNTILSSNIITGAYDFVNLNAQEQIPGAALNLYDQTVEDNTALTRINTSMLATAQLSCTVDNGKIRSVQVISGGMGYTVPPTVTISGVGTGAVITTTINAVGTVVSAKVVETGNGYVTAPNLTVRPYTVVVLADDTYYGKWALFTFDSLSKHWIRAHTQAYNTTLYWSYIDWSSTDYNSHKDYTITVSNVPETIGLLLSIGDYVKVLDNGLGNYIILEYVGTGGNYSIEYNIVYSQNGTIKLSNDLWDLPDSNLGYDDIKTYDQTLYDQTPDLELNYILTALKENIFINALKVKWNSFFFKAVKYAMSEQKLLDWAFKTSFISVTNDAGELSQPPVYKLTSSTNFEQYIKEVKPYHTQIRTFTEQYDVVDPTATYSTDFENSSNPLVDPIREMDITMKFDRISTGNQLGDTVTSDSFICDGSKNSFQLTWLAQADKALFTVTLDGRRVIGADYTVDYYTADYNGYNKQFSAIKFLNYVPNQNQRLQVVYTKSTQTLTAAERILMYYTATSGMSGLDFGQLMDGIEYPKTHLQTLSFDYSTDWDVTTYGTTTWGDSITSYVATTVTTTATLGTSTIVLSTVNGISVGQLVNVTSTLTNVFGTTTAFVSKITGTSVVINSTVTSIIKPGSIIEFWSLDSNSYALDTAIDGGTWSGKNLINALGINPTDVTIDGDGFYTPNTSHAPEELVPGQTSDSLGIDVYTKTGSGAPIIFTGVFDTITGTNTIVTLPALPTDLNSITVTSGFKNFVGIDSPNGGPYVLSDGQFAVDWSTQSLLVYTSSTQSVGYTITSIGGGSGNDAGALDHKTITVLTTELDNVNAQVTSLASTSTVKGAYVTINGVKISTVKSSQPYYELTLTSSYDSRASVNVYGLQTGTNTVQAWFFASADEYFNEISQQVLTIVPGDQYYTLSTPQYGVLGPAVASTIVQVQNVGNILNPPPISYYTVSSQSPSYLINSSITRQANQYNLSQGYVDVYLNGIELRTGFDYTIGSDGKSIVLAQGVGTNGDALAIVDLYPDTVNVWDYNVKNGQLYIQNTATYLVSGTVLNVTTYNDPDGLLMRSQRFVGSPSNTIKLSSPPLSTNLMWVYLNNIPLIAAQDYQILSDGVTIQISDKYALNVADIVVVRSIKNPVSSATVLGYRIFNDMLNRTVFKRLSANNTTYLTQPLAFTDTEIHVDNAGVLTMPIPSKKLPGVVLIAGERIEFYQVNGNVLSQLRRSTLGTAPKFYSEIYTDVIDQGTFQTIPFGETILTQNIYTTSTTATYTISTVTNAGSDGIILSKDETVAAADQVQVYYGGRLLNKTGIYYQDLTVAYDNPTYTIVGTQSTATSFPSTTVLGTAYLVTATNQVWIYQNSNHTTSVNGYVYSGLNYLPPEFSINTSTQEITLNIQEGVGDNIKLAIVKKQLSETALWNNGISLLNSTTVPAKFLQEQPAKLPDNYYYGGDPDIIIESGFVLTDNNNEPLEGF